MRREGLMLKTTIVMMMVVAVVMMIIIMAVDMRMRLMSRHQRGITSSCSPKGSRLLRTVPLKRVGSWYT